MEKIASFTVNHNTLTRGMYISRCDGDIVTYDLRFRRPNCGNALDCAVSHSIEHLMATALRNGSHADSIIYFGPMGCRTGFYLLVRGLTGREALDTVLQALQVVSRWKDPLPGNTAAECGNYLDHDMPGAIREVSEYQTLLKNWTEEKMTYPK